MVLPWKLNQSLGSRMSDTYVWDKRVSNALEGVGAHEKRMVKMPLLARNAQFFRASVMQRTMYKEL